MPINDVTMTRVTRGAGSSFGPTISADGTRIAFMSDDSSLVQGDTNGTFDVFVSHLVTGTVQRVSTSATDIGGDDLFGFSRGFGTDRVTDFTRGQDKLRIKGFGTILDSFAELQAPSGGITQGSFDTVAEIDTKLALPSGTTVILSGFSGTLTSTDFLFVA